MTAPTPTASFGDTSTNTIAGAAGGVVSVLLADGNTHNTISKPDLIKVQLQTHGSGNVFQVVSRILKDEGPLAFYKGALLPFLGVGAAVSIQFSVFHNTIQALYALRARDSRRVIQQPSILDLYLAGGIAGVANSIVSGPVEHIRIRLQTQAHGPSRLYAGPWDCIRQITGTAGVKGLFRGQNTAVLREFQAYGLYFATFEACVSMITTAKEMKRDKLPTWTVASCGALSGVAFWVGSYPLDTVKTKLQSDGFGQYRRYKNAWGATVEAWKSGGVKAFFRGLGPTLLRTMLSSAGTFAMVENVKRFLA
ncbi:MC family mitochondrial carrier protein [Fonsecaea erecta]|uniref:MC family mitochondrial carrier protein n=1 Tax=Fonsecaea erecta TaxID=1367422 RepID=A0A178ZKH7_9EURO|nr:MC family mitochondrial carrier protein [Fonsecaea erecta]OAP59703.1 MC family mitochondrial carrier protein [Fonsecaea erecta]